MTPPSAAVGLVGTYADSDAEGVHTVRFDPEAGTLDRLDSAVAGGDPSYLACHPDGETAYVVNETAPGTVTTFEVDPTTGALSRVARVASGGDGPCYCSVDATGRWLLAAHYPDGTVSALPIEDDRRPGDPAAVVVHEGASVDPDRQNRAHPHSVVPGPENRFAYVADLGTDAVVRYRLDPERMLDRVDAVAVRPGAGPRHLRFGPAGDRAYLINELDGTIVAFEREDSGALSARTTVSTLPPDFEGHNQAADIAVHPTGTSLYGSNRGHDSIAAFRLDDGDPTPVGHTPTGGEWPRNIALDPSGTHLLAQNRRSDDVVVFEIDRGTGDLAPTGDRLAVSEPACLRWLPES